MAGKFDETAIGLALLCKLPIDLAERMMAREQSEEVIIATRAFGFSWDTAKALLMLRANGAGDFEQERAAFEKLTQVTAKKALGFVRMRDKSSTDRTGGANHLY